MLDRRSSQLPRSAPTVRAARIVLVASSLALAPLSLGCGGNYIPNTDVEDTEDNRRFITFCEQYRKAVERKDVAKLLSLASDKYYEDGGNVDASDDLDYAGLKDYLTGKFNDSRAIRYEIRYRRVLEEDDMIYVDYTFSASFRIPSADGEGDEWRRQVDDNRLILVPHEDSFKIVAGM